MQSTEDVTPPLNLNPGGQPVPAGDEVAGETGPPKKARKPPRMEKQKPSRKKVGKISPRAKPAKSDPRSKTGPTKAKPPASPFQKFFKKRGR